MPYRDAAGRSVHAQAEAFCDTWELDGEKECMVRNMPRALKQYGLDASLAIFWKSGLDALRETQPKLLAYLVYMTYRLLEMRRILSNDGSIYLHCDPTASHYLKVVMDGIFGHENFRNEIVWCRARQVQKEISRESTISFYVT